MSELGVVFDPADVLIEQCCSVSAANTLEGADLSKQNGVVSTYGDVHAPIEVCSRHFFAAVASCERFKLVRVIVVGISLLPVARFCIH